MIPISQLLIPFSFTQHIFFLGGGVFNMCQKPFQVLPPPEQTRQIPDLHGACSLPVGDRCVCAMTKNATDTLKKNKVKGRKCWGWGMGDANLEGMGQESISKEMT